MLILRFRSKASIDFLCTVGVQLIEYMSHKKHLKKFTSDIGKSKYHKTVSKMNNRQWNYAFLNYVRVLFRKSMGIELYRRTLQLWQTTVAMLLKIHLSNYLTFTQSVLPIVHIYSSWELALLFRTKSVSAIRPMFGWIGTWTNKIGEFEIYKSSMSVQYIQMKN